MAESRRERIEAMLSEDPTDDFLRYGLALEWIEEGQHERGLGDLRQLMEQEVPYLPAFPVAGKLLARLGRLRRPARSYEPASKPLDSRAKHTPPARWPSFSRPWESRPTHPEFA